MQLSIIWTCHIAIALWMVKCPFHFVSLKRTNRLKYIHAIIGFIAMVIPIVPVAVALATGGFVNARFPPFLCIARSANATFYALVLPSSIFIPSGVSLLLVIFWNLQKVNEVQLDVYTECISNVH